MTAASGLPPRAAAWGLWHAVWGRGGTLDQAIENDAAFRALGPRDRAFAGRLVATVLRRLGEIDAALAACLDKPLPRNAETVRNALRLGAAQLLFLETPGHAAVATSVALIPGRFGRLKGLTNAVLRRLSREGDLRARQDAGRLNTPDWLWRRWSEFHGGAHAGKSPWPISSAAVDCPSATRPGLGRAPGRRARRRARCGGRSRR